MSRTILVTGAAGFIGSHVVAGLLRRGDTVVAFDDFSSGTAENLAVAAGDRWDDVRAIEGTVTDADALRAAAAGVDGVVHLAARPSVVESLEDPLRCHEVNATGTLHALRAAHARGVPLVFAGSSSAYGDGGPSLLTEDRPTFALSPYAAAKLAGEAYCQAFARSFGLPTVILRFFNVFGPRQSADSPYSGVVAAFCAALQQGRVPRIDGDGGQTRDFVFVDDVVRAILAALDRASDRCCTLNIGAGAARSVLDLLDALRRIAGRDVAPRFAPPRDGDVRHSCADIGAAATQLDYRPQTSFEDGLQATYDWYRRTAVS